MLINGKSISFFNAELNGRVITENSISQDITFNAAMSLVSHSGQELGAKSIALEFLIFCGCEDEFFDIKSQLLMELKTCTLIFPDISRIFKAYLKGTDDYTKLKNGVYKLSVDLIGDFALGLSYSISEQNQTSIECINNGIYPTPVTIKITCKTQTERIVITGFNETITLKNLPASTPIIINSTDGTIKDESGANMFKYYDSWSLPVLPVGISNINISTACDVDINYNELF